MDFDYRALGFWLAVAQWGFQGIVVIWVYLRTKDTDNHSAIRQVATDLDVFIKAAAAANESQNNRLTALEVRMEHTPTKEAVERLTGEMLAVKTSVEGLAGLLSVVRQQTGLIHQHLLQTKQ